MTTTTRPPFTPIASAFPPLLSRRTTTTKQSPRSRGSRIVVIATSFCPRRPHPRASPFVLPTATTAPRPPSRCVMTFCLCFTLCLVSRNDDNDTIIAIARLPHRCFTLVALALIASPWASPLRVFVVMSQRPFAPPLPCRARLSRHRHYRCFLLDLFLCSACMLCFF